MPLEYVAPKVKTVLPLSCQQALLLLGEGVSWVLVSNPETDLTIRLNRTPDENFLLMAPMTMVEFSDVEMAMNVAEQVLRGQLTLEAVREMYPAVGGLR